LVGHLKSDDFFGVEKYPTSNFIITQSSKFDENKATVTGVITIKGKSENISFDVERKNNEYSAKLDIDRSKFDVRYGSNSFFDNLGDKAIDDIFTLDIKLVLNESEMKTEIVKN
jgi:polyisoprenoid-binding protein YceI